MSRRMMILLWVSTGLVALCLTAATMSLSARVKEQADVGIDVYLVGRSVLIHLRGEPKTVSPIVAVVGRDTPGTVVDSATYRSQVWYYVKTKDGDGWIRSDYISKTQGANGK